MAIVPAVEPAAPLVEDAVPASDAPAADVSTADLSTADAPVTEAPVVAAPAARISTLRFTGDGAEYFRIWVVNTLLTLLTLGIYSAWAKVRKTRYFWQNTTLDGYAFDYHARPWPILRGRILALVLAFGYSMALDFSRTSALVMIAVLCLVGPWLFLKSQQFKLVNTSWRGLRFGFESSLAQAYVRVLPVLLLWFASTIASVLFLERYPWTIAVTAIAFVVMLPWMHHRLKAFQHGGVRWGDLSAQFNPCVGGFYKTYVLGTLLMIGLFLPTAFIGGIAVVLTRMERHGEVATIVMGGLIVLVIYVLGQPYVATRLQQRIWGASQLGPVRFHTNIKAFRLMRIVLLNGGATLLTLGLYWPFAAIAFARYRIECMQVEAPAALDEVSAGVQRRAVDATGDGAADAFGLDIGL